jgi:hypothetical protein
MDGLRQRSVLADTHIITSHTTPTHPLPSETLSATVDECPAPPPLSSLTHRSVWYDFTQEGSWGGGGGEAGGNL